LGVSDRSRFVQVRHRQSTTAFKCVTRARVIDKDPPHGLRGDGKKVVAVLPVHAFVIDELQVSLIDQSGSLQRVLTSFLFHVVMGQPPEFLVNEWNQAFQSGLVTITPFDEKLGNRF
jgi:hypothetical protein